MILKLSQTEKELYSARFEIYRESAQAGTVSLQGTMGSRNAVISGNFYRTRFEMESGENHYMAGSGFRPYRLAQDGLEVGVVCQTMFSGGFFNKFEYYTMVKNGQAYDMFPVGLGKEGNKYPVYCGDAQIAMAEKDCVVCDDLHQYRILAQDVEAALVTLLFCLHLYVNESYKPGVKTTEGKMKYVSLTTNKTLKRKYDPAFKDRIGR